MDAIEYLGQIPQKNKDRDFLIDSHTGEHLTFGEVHRYACAIASDIIRRGLHKGDRMAILLDNSVDTVLLYFGCLYAGVVTVPINPVYTKEEISFFVQHSGASLVVVSEDTVSKVCLDLLRARHIQVMQLSQKTMKNSVKASISFWNLRSLPKKTGNFRPFQGVTPEDTLTIIYTSGTTAEPKGVVHRISDLIDNARLFARELDIGIDNRFYGILSLSYLGGYYNLLLLPYAAGSSLVLSRTFNAKSALDFWEPARQYEVNTLWLVPTILSILMKIDRGDKGETFCREKIKCALVGTAPLPVKLREDFEKRYGILLYENYGLSETLFITTNSPKSPRLDGCVGKILPGIQVTILDDSGNALPYAEEGEIFVRTPFLMKHYYRSDSAETEVLARGEWFATGDIGVLTANGDLFITGRKKDLIIRGGINISPMAIENVLHQHPAIEQAVVVGIPHEFLGEGIVAVIKLKEGYVFNETINSIKMHCREKLGNVREIGHIFEISEFPYGLTGKILKKRVREIVNEKLKVSLISSENTYSAESASKTQLTIIPGRIRRSISRPDLKYIEALKRYPASLVSDCFNRMGVMNGGIQPIVHGCHFCGPAVTVEEVEGGNLMSHAALEVAMRGDVLVIDAKGVLSRACWGGLQTYMAQLRGLAGVVIFGAIRDYAEVVKSKMPVYALGISPAGPLKGWGGNVNYPIACAGVVVRPGDLVRGDDDGVVVIPQEVLPRLLPLCEKAVSKEKEWFSRVEAGESTLKATGLGDKLKSFNTEIE